MSSHDRPVHDVLGRMSDDDEDDVPDDLDLTFVPRKERLQRQHRAHAPQPASTSTLATASPASSSSPHHHHHAGSGVAASPDALSSSEASSARVETVYEQERNAKVRQHLAVQRKAHADCGGSGVFSFDPFEAQLDALQGPSSALEDQHLSSQHRQGGRPFSYANRGGASGNDGPRRFRMPHPNMTEEEQQRYIRSRRSIAVTRNALREVDPDTLEYMQITQAADQVMPGRGYQGGGGGRGRGGGYSSGSPSAGGGYAMRGRGMMGQRGRGGGSYGDGRGGYGYAGRGRGGGMPFNPY